jgi:ribosomal protein L40E
MDAQDRPNPDARICRNCRYVAFRPGADLRCLEPAMRDGHLKVQPTSACSRFRISFAAAKLIAFRNGARKPPEAWELAMHRHLFPRNSPPS